MDPLPPTIPLAIGSVSLHPSPITAVIVSVDYADLLQLTLPYNRHHFDRVIVVTSPNDFDTQRVAVSHHATPFATDAFYRDGAAFNKYRALEEGLDFAGRDGWICLLDADILIPRGANSRLVGNRPIEVGTLYSPLRYMMPSIPTLPPSESKWSQYPLHPQTVEWAGYFQLFHGSDPALPTPPWHSIDLTSAGTGDSLFQSLWKRENKVRLDFNVLHLGPAGVNWMGRVSPYADGSVPSSATERYSALQQMLSQRRGKMGLQRFERERIVIGDGDVSGH